MHFNSKDYNPAQHDRWRALTVKNPYATQLVTAAYEDNGIVYGEKCIEVRSKNTPYRGDLMVCSSANPVIPGYENGVTLGLVELYDVKPVADFTPEDWENTRIPQKKRKSGPRQVHFFQDGAHEPHDSKTTELPIQPAQQLRHSGPFCFKRQLMRHKAIERIQQRLKRGRIAFKLSQRGTGGFEG